MSIDVKRIMTNCLCRFRGIDSASHIQLWILSSPNTTNIHYLYGIQRFTQLMANLVLRSALFRDRQLRIQVSAALRHGPQPAFHWQSMVDHLRSYSHRPDRLSNSDDRSFSSTKCLQTCYFDTSTSGCYRLVHSLLSAFV